MFNITYNVGQLCFCDQVLSLSSYEFLLKSDNSWAARFLVLEFCDLVADLGLVVTAWLDAALGVSDLLQDASVVLEVLSKKILLFTNF